MIQTHIIPLTAEQIGVNPAIEQSPGVKHGTTPSLLNKLTPPRHIFTMPEQSLIKLYYINNNETVLHTLMEMVINDSDRFTQLMAISHPDDKSFLQAVARLTSFKQLLTRFGLNDPADGGQYKALDQGLNNRKSLKIELAANALSLNVSVSRHSHFEQLFALDFLLPISKSNYGNPVLQQDNHLGGVRFSIPADHCPLQVELNLDRQSPQCSFGFSRAGYHKINAQLIKERLLPETTTIVPLDQGTEVRCSTNVLPTNIMVRRLTDLMKPTPPVILRLYPIQD